MSIFSGPRYAIVNSEGKTVLEGPRFLIHDVAAYFDIEYPGQYTVIPAIY